MRRLLVLAVASLCVVAAAFLLAQSAPKAPAPSKAAPSVTMPPMPSPGYAPGRPVEVARAVYDFAARHPEVLKYVPCYCGCESEGHPHNESCFVKRRDAKGNVMEWDTHGYGWAVCIDVARDAMLMFNSGADVQAIRGSIERKWTPKFQTKTPTPLPPSKKK